MTRLILFPNIFALLLVLGCSETAKETARKRLSIEIWREKYDKIDLEDSRQKVESVLGMSPSDLGHSTSYGPKNLYPKGGTLDSLYRIAVEYDSEGKVKAKYFFPDEYGFDYDSVTVEDGHRSEPWY